MDDRSDLAEIAKAAAAGAAALLSARGTSVAGIHAESGRDIKLVADQQADERIAAHLRAHTEIPILSEEGDHAQRLSGRIWVVDPLDGSANYNRRIPLSAVSIALLEDGVPVLGVIQDIASGEVFCGGEGMPATGNTAPIKVSDKARKSEAVLATGLPVLADYSEAALTKMARDFADWKKVRMLGSAALAAAWVAAGRVDRYTETGARLWDVAAGLAIAQAAGGRAELSAGTPDAPRTVLIDNNRLPR